MENETKIKRLFEYKKPDGKWQLAETIEDEKTVYTTFSVAMRAKFIYKAPYYKRLIRHTFDGGFEKYVFYLRFDDSGSEYRETFILKIFK